MSPSPKVNVPHIGAIGQLIDAIARHVDPHQIEPALLALLVELADTLERGAA